MELTDRRIALFLDSEPLRTYYSLPWPYAGRLVGSWDALRQALRKAPPSTVAVVDPLAGAADGEPSPELRDALRERPSVPFVAALPLRADTARHAAAVLEWGVSEILDTEAETRPAAVLHRLDAAHGRPFVRRVEPALSRYVSPHAVTLVRAAAAVAVDRGAAPALAARFGVRARTVAGWCAREALPPPRRLLAWMRVLLAATLREEPHRTVSAVARACGYVDDRSLRKAVLTLVGAEAADGAEAPFAAGMRALNAELRDRREAARERARARRGREGGAAPGGPA